MTDILFITQTKKYWDLFSVCPPAVLNDLNRNIATQKLQGL